MQMNAQTEAETGAEQIPLPGYWPAELEQVQGEAGEIQGKSVEEAADSGARLEENPKDAFQDKSFLAGLWRRHEEEQAARWRTQVEAWRNEVAADAELGGERFEASVARAQLALSRFDQGGKIGRLLEISGYGNHPDIVRFFNRLADAVMEDVPCAAPGDFALPPLEERMYPHWRS